MRLWDVSSGAALQTLKGHKVTIYSVCFSPDGSRLASSSWDRTIKLWDTITGQEVITLQGHTDGVQSVAFTPDGKHLASASRDGTIKIWDASPLDDRSR